MSPKNKPQKVLTLKKLLKVVNPIKKSAPDSYPIGKPKYPDAYSKLSTMKPSPQKKVVKAWAVIPGSIRKGKKYPNNWDLFIPTFTSSKKAKRYIYSYVSTGMDAKVVPCTISYTVPSVNKKSSK